MKLVWHEKKTPVPSEFLLNCGTVTISLYLVTKSSTWLGENIVSVILGIYKIFVDSMCFNPFILYLYRRQDTVESVEDEKSYSKSLLLYVMMKEPNVYMSQLHSVQKVQVRV